MGEYDELLIRTRNLKVQNDESVFKLFNERSIYRKMLTEQVTEHPNIVDFNLGEKFLFGRVNSFFVPIELRTPTNLKRFNTKFLPNTLRVSELPTAPPPVEYDIGAVPVVTLTSEVKALNTLLDEKCLTAT